MKQFVVAVLICLFASSSVWAQTIDQGRTQLENENFAAARKTFNQLIAKDASNAEAYFYLGESYYMDEKADSARLFYQKGVDASSKSAINQIGLGKLDLDANKPAEAKKHFDQALKASKSKDAQVFYLIGSAYLDSQHPNHDAAIEHLTKARDMNTKNALYFIKLGDAYLAKNDGGNAMTNYEFAISKEPSNPRGYMRKAILARRANLTDEAISTLEKTIQLDPNYAPAYKDLVEVYVSKNMSAKVTPLLEKYVTLVGTDLDARSRYVRYLAYQAKDYNKAIEEANKVLAADPTRVTMYRWLGWAHYEKGEYQQAFDNMKKFVENPGTNKLYTSDYQYYAQAAEKLNDMTTAMTQYQAMVKLDSTKADMVNKMMGKTFETQAKAAFDAKDYTGALNAYNQKKALTPLNSTDYYYVGRAQYSLKNYVQADSAFMRVTELLPTWPSGYLWRGRANEQMDPEAKMGLALPHYLKLVPLAQADLEKYRKDLIEGYLYMAYYYYSQNDLPNAKTYYQQVVDLDPTNKTATDALAALGGR